MVNIDILGTFSSMARVGRPRSKSPVDVRLDETKQHLSIVAEHIGCVKVRTSLGGSRSSLRHVSQIRAPPVM